MLPPVQGAITDLGRLVVLLGIEAELARGQGRHAGDGAHGTGREELRSFNPTLEDQIHSHERIKNFGFHAHAGGIDSQYQ